MTTYYVGSGGNNANAGTSWSQRKLTLNGVEDIPVAAGDTVYVAPGVTTLNQGDATVAADITRATA